MKAVCIALVFVTVLAVGSAYHVNEWGEISGCGNIVLDEVVKLTPLPYGQRRITLNYPTYVSRMVFQSHILLLTSLFLMQVEDEQYEIKYVKVTDMLPYGKSSYSEIMYGGPGEMFVGLEIKSARGVGIHSRVEVCALDDGMRKKWGSYSVIEQAASLI